MYPDMGQEFVAGVACIFLLCVGLYILDKWDNH